MKLFCPLIKKSDFQKIIEIKKFPVFMGTTNKKQYKYLDLKWWINKKTGSVQIYPKAKLNDVYFKSHGSGSIGTVWKKHHFQFFNFIKKYLVGNICELGGGSNSIIHQIDNYKKIINFFVFDKNFSLEIKNRKIKVIKKFYEEKLISENIKFNLFVHSHTFEHLYDPLKVLNSINRKLYIGGYHAFSIPNMKGMLKNKIASVMNFEHPYYYDEDLVETLLNQCGFKILRKKYFLKSHSIFYLTKKTNKKYKVNSYSKYEVNKRMFENYKNYWTKNAKNYNEKLKKLKNKDIYLFGAHIFSQMLLFNGLNSKLIKCILDNDINKHDERLYGTDLIVREPNIICNLKDPVVILKAGEYNREIKSQLKKINQNVRIIL